MTTAIRPPVETRIGRVSASGFPLVTRSAIRRAGVARSTMRERVSDGRLVPLLRTVMSIGDPGYPPSPDLLAMAAVLEAGDGGALFGATALVRLGVWESWRDDGSIHVVSPRALRPIPKFDITFHRCADPIPHEIVVVDRIPTCAPIDACMQASTQQTPHQLAQALRRAVYRDLLTIEAFAARVGERPGQRGVVIARRAIELYRSNSAGTKSPSEDRALPHLVRAFGEPLVNVMGAAGIPDYEPDFLWRRERIIVEIDGRPHELDPVTIERDRARDELLRAAGWIVVRIPYRRVWNQMSRVIAELRTQFASRV